MKKWLSLYKADVLSKQLLPFADEGIRAGFPSPAQDYMEMALDLNKELIKNPASTFLGRVKGTSMKDENISDGDILVIDKSLDLENNDLAVCYIDGEFTLKRVEIDKNAKIVWLVPSNTEFPRIKVTEDNQFWVWGIVVYTIKKNRKRRV
ncbi:LexA family protein [Bacteroides timonensis]|uniref:LexA family protein n=1 Tax=Bacteroides timonensis TaxID=1470345 RepID=UPI0004BA1123|nr:translesion error-prone DNA polymerase V autoproteolytic subunit [Bacteroides timonensis]